MYYLTIMIHQDVAGQEYAQSTTRFADYEEARTEWHTACSSYRKKATTLSCTAVILNDIGTVMISDVYSKNAESELSE